jgi:general secretion pathway protein G
MIELIFVIVILGILAAVAIPKLAATRDDAKISKMASNIQTAKNEVASYVVSQGGTDTNWTLNT